jgi:2-keto-4-pentenoate hydratase/2-oxohepta-3-ene-1,7-dioic acid hydratase in catechol pathway
VNLCRFELKSDPSQIRSGIVYNGKVYETNGSEAIAVYEADQIRPLTPVGQPPAFRVVRALPRLIDADEPPSYFYASPTAMVGASSVIEIPELMGEVDCEAYIGAVLGSDAASIGVETADDIILGYTIVLALVSREAERFEKRVGSGPGRSFDIGIGVGPVLTTPEEIEDMVQDAEFGRRFALEVVVRVNGVDRRRGNVAELPFTFAQAISTASETCPIRVGDLIAMGPLAIGLPENLTSGDEVTVAIELLGAITLKIN